MNIDLTGLDKDQQKRKLTCHIEAKKQLQQELTEQLAKIDRDIIALVNMRRDLECGGLCLNQNH